VILSIEEVEKALDLIPKVLKIVFQFAIAVGTIIVILYAGRVGYYPSGLTFGDTLLFIAVAISFGFSYTLVVFILFCTSDVLLSFITSCLQIFNTNHKIDVNTSLKVGILIFGIIGIALIIYSFFSNRETFFGLLVSVPLMSCFLYIYNTFRIEKLDTDEIKRDKSKMQIIFALLIYIIPLVVGKFQGSAIDQAMRLIGVRNDNATVQFDNDYQLFIEEITKTKDKKMYSVKILFQGLGSSNVLEYENIRLVVPSTSYRMAYENKH